MARALKIVVFLCFALLGCSLAFGQMNGYQYNGSSSISLVGQDFAACSNINCWHANLSAPGNAPQVFSTNGKTFAINANGVYELTDYPNYAWVLHSEFGTVHGIGSDGAGNIYALYAQGGCSSGSYELGKWNGSGFTLLSYCFYQMFVGASGNFLTIDPNGTLWTSIGGWQHVGNPNGKPVISASWINDVDNSFMAVTNDNQIWVYGGGTWLQPLNGACCALTVVSDNNGTFYVLGTDGNVYHFSGDPFSGSGGYSKLAGPGGFSSGYGGLANGGSGNVWGVGPTISNNNLYRFSDQAVRHSRNLVGYANCGGCTHAASTKAQWQSSLVSQDNGASFNGNPTHGINITSDSDLLDPFLCFEGDAQCTTTFANERVSCSIAGALIVASATAPKPRLSYSEVYGVFNGTSSIVSSIEIVCDVGCGRQGNNLWEVTVRCNSSNSCQPNTLPYCSGPGYWDETSVAISQQEAQYRAAIQCEKQESPSGVTWTSVYSPNVPSSCKTVSFDKFAVTPGFCF